MTTTDIIALTIMGSSAVVGGGALVVTKQLIEQLRSLTATVGSMKKVVASLDENTAETRKSRLAAESYYAESNQISSLSALGPQAASEAGVLGHLNQITSPAMGNYGQFDEQLFDDGR